MAKTDIGGRSCYRLATVVLILCSILRVDATADFRVCQQSNKPVYTAYTYYDQRERGFFIVGWFEIPPGSCRSLHLGDVRGHEFRLYGETTGGTVKWSGPHDHCVERPKGFRIKNRGQSCAKTEGFTSIRTGNYSDFTYTLRADNNNPSIDNSPTINPPDDNQTDATSGSQLSEADEEHYEGTGEGGEVGEGSQSNGGATCTDACLYQAVFARAVVFDHPRNGRVYVHLNNGNFYLMRSNSASGAMLGEGGKWSVRGSQLCIDTAINERSFVGCGEFRLGQGYGLVQDRHAEWDHPFAIGLPVKLSKFSYESQSSP